MPWFVRSSDVTPDGFDKKIDIATASDVDDRNAAATDPGLTLSLDFAPMGLIGGCAVATPIS